MSSHFTSLIEAAKAGNAAETARLLNDAPKPVLEARDGQHGATALCWASQNGHESCVGRLVAAGADVNAARKDGATPVSIASEKGNEGCVDRLVAAGADVNAAMNGGATPVLVASQEGNEGCVDRLVAAGADVNAVSYTHLTLPTICSV